MKIFALRCLHESMWQHLFEILVRERNVQHIYRTKSWRACNAKALRHQHDVTAISNKYVCYHDDFMGEGVTPGRTEKLEKFL